MSSAGVLRYTMDVTIPVASSPIFPSSMLIDASGTLTLAGFVDHQRVSESCRYQVNLVKGPTLGQMVHLDLSSKAADGLLSSRIKTEAKAYAAAHATVTDQGLSFVRGGQDSTSEEKSNVDKEKGGVGIALQDLRFNDNAMSMAIVAKFKDLNGQLMGKFGRTATGKSYQTAQISLHGGALRGKAQPADMRPRTKLKADRWHSLVFTGSGDETCLYLDGKLISKGIGAARLPITSLEFFVNMEVVVSELRVYNRPLQPHEVERLSELAFKNRVGE